MHLDDYWRPFFRNPSRLGDRERDGEHAGDDAESPDQLAPDADWRDALTWASRGTSDLSPKPPLGQDTEQDLLLSPPSTPGSATDNG